MKKMTIKIAMIIGVMALSVACMKEEFKINSSEVLTYDSSETNLKKASFVNPYNFVGEIHNTLLIQAINDGKFASLNNLSQIEWMESKVASQLLEYGQSTYINTESINPDIKIQLANSIPDANSDYQLYFDNAINQLSAQEQLLIRRMEQKFHVYESNHDLNKFIKNMENLEHSVFKNNSISPQTKEFILSIYAVGKHSFTYWNTGQGESIAQLPRWLRDIGGFATGVAVTFACYDIIPDFAGACGNPIANGVAAATAASAREDREE